jgi:hypothetical protein
MAISPNATQITPPRVPIIDERTGAVSREWYRWFYSLYNIVGGGLGVIPVSSGGTGLSTIPTNGQLLIGNGTGYTLNTLGVGAGISVTNGIGTITLVNTGVLSFSGGATGLTPATATTGAVTLAGTLIAVNGGTGFASYTIGDLLYADTTTTLAKLPDVATGNALISGGVSAAPAWGKIGLTTHVSGVLPIANGGTNTTATPTAYGVAYGTGTAYAFTAAGTTKQALLANTGAAPTWSTLTTGASILYGDGSGGFSNVTIGTGVSFVGGTLSATGTGGTVTSVTGTSPVVSSGGTTPAISLAAGYGDTLNPYASKTANFVLAAPNGSAGAPTFRALVAADVPGSALTKTDDTNVTLTLGGSPTTALLNAASLTLGWSGQLAVGRGGTGLSAGTSGGIPYFSSTSAITSSALLTQYGVIYGGGAGSAPVATAAGTTGQVLTATTGGAPTWAAPATSGTVTSVAATVPSFLSVTGSPITTSGTLAISYSGTALPIANGGTGLTSYTAGDLSYYASGTSLTNLAIGAANTVLTSSGSAPQWSTGLLITSLTVTNGVTNTNINLTSEANAALAISRYSTNVNAPAINLRKGRGTIAAQTTVASGDLIGDIFGQVYDGTNTINATLIRTQVITYTGAANINTAMLFLTRPTGGAAVVERMRITTGVSIGTTTDPGVGNLLVSGTVNTGGYTVATLPAGVTGARAYVTNALAPAYGAAVAGGGAVTIPVFYNGANWIVG